jgi:hypothetical protein
VQLLGLAGAEREQQVHDPPRARRAQVVERSLPGDVLWDRNAGQAAVQPAHQAPGALGRKQMDVWVGRRGCGGDHHGSIAAFWTQRASRVRLTPSRLSIMKEVAL